MSHKTSLSFEQLSNDYENEDLYQELIVCSNILINTKHIMATNEGWHPLVVRKGESPMVWLSYRELVPSEDNTQSPIYSYIQLINNSNPLHPQVSIESTTDGFQIKVGDTILAEAGNHRDGELEIYALDMRPLGLNIYGDHRSINIGSNSISRSTSSNSGTMFGIG
jgi:hypothetical protein